jgi:cbb3-type cytochrome oxidase maturation protein
MDVLPLLIVISLIVVGLVVWLFFQMSSGGQFDDLESPAPRILLDDDAGPEREAPDLSNRKAALGRNAEGVEPAGRGNTHGAGQSPEAKN